MKLVKESLSFERGQSPKTSMGIGKEAKIRLWLDKRHIQDYTINTDFTIDVNGDVELDYLLMDELMLPEVYVLLEFVKQFGTHLPTTGY